MFLIKKHPFLCKKCDVDPILENWNGSSIDTTGLFCNICDVYFGDWTFYEKLLQSKII